MRTRRLPGSELPDRHRDGSAARDFEAMEEFINRSAGPQLTSVDLVFDEKAGTLSLKAVGGNAVSSALWEISDTPTFTATILFLSDSLFNGESKIKTTAALTSAQRFKKWYGRVTPYSGPTLTGIVGTPMQDTVYAGGGQLVSVDITYDQKLNTLSLKAVGGNGVASARWEISDDPAFGTTILNTSDTLIDGESKTKTTAALTAAQRFKKWYGRVTPYSGAGLTGTQGTPMQDSVYAGGDGPLVAPRAELSADADTADVYAVVFSPSGEQITLQVMLEDGGSVWSLVGSNGSVVAHYVASSTELGPSNWFYNGTSASWGQILNDIALTRDQIKRLFFRVVGENSGNLSTWIPFALDLNGMPWLEKTKLTWNEVTDQLESLSNGGARCQSAIVQFDDDSAFGSVANTQHISLTDGGIATAVYALAAADRNKPWHARVTPYNGPLSGGFATGLAGKPQDASARVEGNVSKSYPFSHTDFVPDGFSYGDINRSAGIVSDIGGDGAASRLYANVPARVGETLTSIAARMNRSNVACTATLELFKIDQDGVAVGGTPIATCTHATVGWATVTDDFADEVVVAGYRYVLKLTLEAGGGMDADFTSADVYFKTAAAPAD